MNLDPSQCVERFQAARVAAFATSDALNQPHLVPVTFALDGQEIYFVVDQKPKRSPNLKRLANIRENPLVSLLVDDYDDDWSRLWWVRADGSARIITDPAERSRPLELLQGRYEQYQREVPTGAVVAIAVARWVGWAFQG